MAIPVVGLEVTVRGVAQATQRMQQLGQSVRNVGAQAQSGGQRLGRMPFQAVRGQVESLGRGFRRLGQHMTSTGSVISTVGFRMSAMIGLPIVGFMAKASQAASGFEDEMVKMVTLVGITADEAENLTKQILNVAPALGVTPTELAAASYFVLSNRITDTATALEIASLAAKGSAVGLGETETIARILTAAVVAYGEENITAAQAADQLTRAVQLGAVEAEEFAEPLGRALGLASNIGVTFAEATGFITIFTSSGISASEAVTGLNRVMASFAKPTEKAKDALEVIGETADSASEKLGEQGLARTLIEFRQKFEEAGVPVSDYIGRITGLNAALFNTGAAGDAYLDSVDEITTANGTLEKSFEVVQESTSFQWKQLKSTMEAVAITIGGILLPAVNSIIQKLIPLLDAVKRFAEQHPKVVMLAAAFGLLVAVVGPLIVGMGLLVSTLGIVFQAIGTFFAIIAAGMSTIGIFGGALVALASTIGGLFLASLSKMNKDLDLSFSNIASNAFQWGLNVIRQLARGMAAAAIAVVTVLNQIGQMIANWLAPGSPPKLLPDIDNWGREAMNEYIRGFASADFDIFGDIASIAASFLRSMPSDVIPEEGLIPAILGARSAAAQAVDEINRTGQVTESTLNRIAGSYGRVSDDVKDYVRILADLKVAQNAVAAATEEINRINAEFERATAPLSEELEGIRDRYEEVKQAQEVAKLEAILRDPRAPALARELAMLGLREIELNNAIAQEEEIRDTALEGANDRLDAAKAEEERLKNLADAQRDLIEVQLQNNKLVEDQIDTLDRLADALDDLSTAGIGGAAGDITPADLSGFDPTTGDGGVLHPDGDLGIPSLTDIIGEGITGSANELLEEVQAFVGELTSYFEPLSGEGGLIDQLTDTWANLFTTILNDGGAMAKVTQELGAWAAILASAVLIPKVWALGGAISGAVTAAGGFGGIIAGIATVLAGPLVVALLLAIGALVALFMKFGSWTDIAEAIRELFTGSGVFGPQGIMVKALNMLAQRFGEWVLEQFFRFRNWARKVRHSLQQWAEHGGEIISNWISNTSAWFGTWIENLIQNFADWADRAGGEVGRFIEESIASFGEWVESIIPTVSSTLQEIYQAIVDFDLVGAGEDLLKGLLQGIENIKQALVNTILHIAEEMKRQWNEFWGLSSPSKLMIESGQQILGGLQIGLSSEAQNLAASFAQAGAMGHNAFMSGTVASGVTNTRTTNVSMGPVNVNNGMDEAAFDARVRRAVASAM